MYFWSNHYHFLISAKIGLSFFSSSSFRCKVSCILEIFLFYQYIFLNFSSYLLIYLNLNIYLFSQLVAISNSKDSPVKVLHSICQQIWKTQQWSQDWKMSVFIPIPKKVNAKECSNYCTTELISHTSKVMVKILQARLQQYMNHELPDVQHGFRKGSSVHFGHSVMCDSLWCYEPQHARPPCPSPTPRVYPNPCPLSWWCHTTISSSVVPFSYCLQSCPASEAFPVSQFFALGGQSIGVSASASVLPRVLRTDFL